MSFLCLLFFSLTRAYFWQGAFYNLENLFDTENNPQKNDQEFLPRSHPQKKCHLISHAFRARTCRSRDWNESALEQKLYNLAQVIKELGPLDFLAVAEVENQKMLNRLARKVNLEALEVGPGNGSRGLTQGLLIAQKWKKYFLAQPLVLSIGTTREIVIYQLKLKKKKMYLAVNHWPSQFAPDEARIRYAEALRDFMKTTKPGEDILWMGDFNTKRAEKAFPYHYFSSPNPFERYPRTYFFQREQTWHSFDLVGIKRDSSLKLLSAQVHRPWAFSQVFEGRDLQGNPRRVWRVPQKFQTYKGLGASDHWPIVFRFQW